ncbi:MAG TPA: hypothetical protein VJQ54_04815 [Candidatus Sulfotelmatobacter sp.]|nr:hypothetical protein [Candidatus Sulfotelmatobacter sp.]
MSVTGTKQRKMLTESQVIASVRRFLEQRGFRITSCLSETEQGIDIEGFAPDGKQGISIEAKGETSSKSGSGRFGNAFDSSQVSVHVAKAFYCAARDYPTGKLVGVAFPKNELHVKCVQKILPAIKTLGIEVFWVEPHNGTVEVEHIWHVWR